MTDAPGNDSARITGTDDPSSATPNEGEAELEVYGTPDEAAAAATERIAAAIVAAIDNRGRADFCTTGGNTPIPIYKALSSAPYRERIDWANVHVWWGDDRFVPRDHQESNLRSFDTVLLRMSAFTGDSGTGTVATDVESGAQPGVPLPPSNIHVFPVDRAIAEGRDEEWCATAYAREMAGALPVDDGNWPVFDLILIGVGDDGHCLSCFPNSQAFDTNAWALGIPAPTHIAPHLPRVTMNPRILDASPVLAVTWGASKAEALGHVFGPERDDHRWPVQRTRRPGAVWIVDEAAAAKIPRDLRG